MRRIDCHMHSWTLAMESHYALWMSPDHKVLYGDYRPHDAKPLMGRTMSRVSFWFRPAASIQETDYLLGHADSNDFIRGGVAWVDMLGENADDDYGTGRGFANSKASAPTCRTCLTTLDPAAGARSGRRDHARARPAPRRACQAVPHLNIVRFIERHPTLPVIVDHMAKPQIRDGAFEPWRCDMEQFRDVKHVHCKLSGILTEDGPDRSPERLRPHFETVIDIFGPTDWCSAATGRWSISWPTTDAGLPPSTAP